MLTMWESLMLTVALATRSLTMRRLVCGDVACSDYFRGWFLF